MTAEALTAARVRDGYAVIPDAIDGATIDVVLAALAPLGDAARRRGGVRLPWRRGSRLSTRGDVEGQNSGAGPALRA